MAILSGLPGLASLTPRLDKLNGLLDVLPGLTATAGVTPPKIGGITPFGAEAGMSPGGYPGGFGTPGKIGNAFLAGMSGIGGFGTPGKIGNAFLAGMSGIGGFGTPTKLGGAFQPQYIPQPPAAQAGSPTNGPANQTTMASPGGTWANVDRWNTEIQNASNAKQVPANLLKAIMNFESGGDPTNMSPQDAYGLMQIHLPSWGYNGPWATDPAANVMKGAEILRESYDRWVAQGAADPWQEAVKDYIGRGAPDAFGTTSDTYWARVKSDWDTLNQFGGGGAGISAPGGLTGGAGTGSPGGSIATIWGGGSPNISQDFGMTDFATGNPIYNYSANYSPTGQPLGHTGLDVSMNVGTALYTPVSGTVVCGGTGYGGGDPTSGCTAFESDVCNAPCGRFEIALDNGDYLILGHMSQVTVQAGQRINAGAMVGYSGTANGGHVHVEYRKNTPGATSSGFTIVDPRSMLTGAPLTGGGGYTPGTTQQTAYQPGANLGWQRMQSLLAGGG